MKVLTMLAALNLIAFLTVLQCDKAYADIPFFQDGVRPAGMGGAFTGIIDDKNAMFHNPAGLAYIKKKSFDISTCYQDYKVLIWIDRIDGELNYNYCDKRMFVSYIQPTSRFTFGIGGGNREKGDDKSEIETWTSEGHAGGTIYWKDVEKMGLVSLSKKLTPKLAAGISLKYVREESDLLEILSACDKEKEAIDLDIGVIRELNEKCFIGLLLQNILKSEIDYIIYDYFDRIVTLERLPRNVNIGVGIRPMPHILIAMDIDNLLEDKVYDKNHEVSYTFKRKYQLGTEVQHKNLFIRVGISQYKEANDFPYTVGTDFQYNKTISYAMGIGFHNKNLMIDFATTCDNRKKEIEKYRLEVKEPTLRYLLSGCLLF